MIPFEELEEDLSAEKSLASLAVAEHSGIQPPLLSSIPPVVVKNQVMTWGGKTQRR
jgi:hypothetical protein